MGKRSERWNGNQKGSGTKPLPGSVQQRMEQSRKEQDERIARANAIGRKSAP